MSKPAHVEMPAPTDYREFYFVYVAFNPDILSTDTDEEVDKKVLAAFQKAHNIPTFREYFKTKMTEYNAAAEAWGGDFFSSEELVEITQEEYQEKYDVRITVTESDISSTQ